MKSPQLKRNLQRILPFGFFWFIFSLIYLLIEKGLLGDLEHYPATGNPYNFESNLLALCITSSLFGLLIGTFEVFYFNRRFKEVGFIQKILVKTFIYLFIIILFLIVNTLLSNAIDLDTNIFDKKVLANVSSFMTDFAFWSVIVYVSAIIVLSLFYFEVSDNMGQGKLNNFLIGKYHQPIEEERIFMFLDMNSSTQIAEQLGHQRYFQMIKAYYSDLSLPIINSLGEVYQYVGDEVVVSWNLENGLEDINCIKCFYDMKTSIANKNELYMVQFGLTPTFKAGIHLGKVTTGEIGVLKKEIVFTGDVLNTTARIQGLCNPLKSELLISGDLLKHIRKNDGIQFNYLGDHLLRGKDEATKIYALKKMKI